MMTVKQKFYQLNEKNIDFVILDRIQYRQGIAADHKVYNLDVDNNHTFFANNLICHNKDDDFEDSSFGCVFPGTQIYLTENTSIDIVDFKGGTQIDFCNPSTLEHSQQQTLNRCIYDKATKKITINLEDGKAIALTANHAVLTPEGFKTYCITPENFPLYKIGDKLATVDGYKQIVSIKESIIYETTVYNIITENSLMVANGIIIAGELNVNVDETRIMSDKDFLQDIMKNQGRI
jgi:intein/homing endonuclease